MNPQLIKPFNIDKDMLFLIDILVKNSLNFNTYYGNPLIRFYNGNRCDLRKYDS